MKRVILFLSLISISMFCFSSEQFRIMFYNVENLFDYKNDSLKNDNEFLPQSVRAWTAAKFYKKVNNIAKVIIASSYDYLPDLVGLCEVENNFVVNTLVKNSPLREAEYRYVMTNSPDKRGIDVALLYQRATFKLIGSNSIRIPNETVKREPTRDILHVTGRILSGDSLDVFVTHFPSRSFGKSKSEPYRMFVAGVLKKYVDSIVVVREKPNVIIMGDFNDYSSDNSLKKILKAEEIKDSISSRHLYNMMIGKKGGTYKYKGIWGTLDQFVVSGAMLRGNNKISTSPIKAVIADYPFILMKDEQYGGEKPFRTYWGMRYQGGYSDHLPIYIDFIISVC